VFGDLHRRKFRANDTCAPGLLVRLQQAALDSGVPPCPTSLFSEPCVSISRNGLASTPPRVVRERERRTMISQFQHILVPVDFTDRNRTALDIVREIAVNNRARVTLLHVIETIDDVDVDDEEVRDFYAMLQQRAERELLTLSRIFSDTDIAVERKVRYGKRAQEIVQDSLDRQIDLIVMSSHTIDVEQPTKGWATLSYQVSVLCQCPVLLVK
jgi:nucleotide-binding universal stress UspA family protein